MEIQGKIIAVLPHREGQSKNGLWKTQEYVLETHETYPKKVAFIVFGEDRIKRFAIKEGQEVNVSFDINAHEYYGKWYNQVTAFDVRLREPVQAPAPQNPNVVYAKDVASEEPTDDLPF